MDPVNNTNPRPSWWARLWSTDQTRPNDDDAADYGTAFGLEMATPEALRMEQLGGEAESPPGGVPASSHRPE